MDFELSEEHKAIQQMVRDFAENKIKHGRIKTYENSRVFPRDIVDKLGKLGLMGVFVPEQYGGAGLDTLAYAICEEELARVWASLGLIVSANNSLTNFPILEFGTEEQKQKYLVPLAKGEKLGCFAQTEPEAGSDVAAIKTSAVKSGEHWEVSGVKTFITNADKAAICVLIARTGKDPHKGLTAFIVETKTPGFIITKVEEKMGLHSSHTCEILFDEHKVPQENVLGQLGDGFKVAMETLDVGRINIAAQAVGIAQGAFDLALEYAKQRKQFGKPICEFQANSFKLADMATELEAARLLTHKAAWLKDRGLPFTKAASMAKMFASEAGTRVVDRAFQIHGGYAYSTDFDIERFYRDIRITQIYEGTNEIQRLVIARCLLGTYKKV